MGDENRGAEQAWVEEQVRALDEAGEAEALALEERIAGYREFLDGDDDGPPMTAKAMLDVLVDLRVEGTSGNHLLWLRKRDLLLGMHKEDLVAQEARRFLKMAASAGISPDEAISLAAMEAACALEGAKPIDRAGAYMLTLDRRCRANFEQRGGALKSNDTPPWRASLVEIAQSLGWCQGKKTLTTQLGAKLSKLAKAESALGSMGAYMRAHAAAQKVAQAMRERPRKQKSDIAGSQR
tara:strand:- start:51285 stop:51998 length:714 start_codon:yes stop_codon:yes gene_type:complete